MHQKRLLIIPCCAEKATTPELLPAWDRYEGIVFTELKAVADRVPGWNDLDIVIISGKYGFLRPSDAIEWYDQQMTPELAAKHRAGVVAGLTHLLAHQTYRDCFVLLEPIYLATLNEILPPNTHIEREITPESLERLIQWILHYA
jgi:hypothetical protein